MYMPENWIPVTKRVEVFKIALDTIEDLKTLFGASSVRTAYNRGGTILIEWTMQHRDTFAGLVGQYVVRNYKNELVVLDWDQLIIDYKPVYDIEEEPVVEKEPETTVSTPVDAPVIEEIKEKEHGSNQHNQQNQRDRSQAPRPQAPRNPVQRDQRS